MLEHALIFESSLVRIGDVHCRSAKGGCGEVERETSPRMVLPRRGAFAYHFSRRHEIVADANTAIALHPQMEFKVSLRSTAGIAAPYSSLPTTLCSDRCVVLFKPAR